MRRTVGRALAGKAVPLRIRRCNVWRCFRSGERNEGKVPNDRVAKAHAAAEKDPWLPSKLFDLRTWRVVLNQETLRGNGADLALI